jgi:hypothetical protein
MYSMYSILYSIKIEFRIEYRIEYISRNHPQNFSGGGLQEIIEYVLLREHVLYEILKSQLVD